MIDPEPKPQTSQDKTSQDRASQDRISQDRIWGGAPPAPLTGRHLRNLARLAKGKLPRIPALAAHAH